MAGDRREPGLAAVYDFTIRSARNTASGRFTVADGTSPFTVTGMTGIVDGATITGLSSYGGANQRLSDATPYADRAGIGFSAGGVDDNIFDNYTDSSGDPVHSFCSSTFDDSCTGRSANAAPVASFTVALASAVPEPASWAPTIGGMGFAGGTMRQRRAARTAIAVA